MQGEPLNFDWKQSKWAPLLFNFYQGVKFLSTARIGTGGRTGRDMISCATSPLRRLPPLLLLRCELCMLSGDELEKI